jgi:hypothetical protein
VLSGQVGLVEAGPDPGSRTGNSDYRMGSAGSVGDRCWPEAGSEASQPIAAVGTDERPHFLEAVPMVRRSLALQDGVETAVVASLATPCHRRAETDKEIH